MTYSAEGFGKLSRNYHDAYRSNLIRSKYVEQPRPILVNNWEATYFDFDADKLYHIAEEAKNIGLDMFVLDDGWFGKRDNDFCALGDWVVNEEKIKGGLPALAERIHGLGLKFGLWVEPEMINEDSDLYREHPDWALKIPGRAMNRSRHQLNLDITRKEVRAHVMNQIFSVLDACKVDYVKWDMNRSVDNVFSAALPRECQGEVYHRYVLAVYEMMESLVQRYPDLLFEGCSGGGGRFEAGMLYYSPQIWCSDNTDAIDRLKIQYGTSFGYPISAMGSHVSVCPNHQSGRITPFETRGIVASAGTFGYELDLMKMSEEEKKKYQTILTGALKNDSLTSKLQVGDERYIGIDLAGAIAHPGSEQWDVVLQDGDHLIIPQQNNTVSINGEVLYPNTVTYKDGASLDYYIDQAGGYGEKARKKRVFAIQMNGMVTRVKSAKDILPGCEIIVPMKKERKRMTFSEIMSLGSITATLGAVIATLVK